jgi:hypothetical protein
MANLINTRREALFKLGWGAGGLMLGTALSGGGFMAAEAATLNDPLAPKEPHFPAKAKTVIWLHQDGAPSTLDFYDYKPELIRLNGQEVPASFLQGIKTSTQGGVGKLFASNRSWKQYGQSGAWFSDWASNIGQHADKMTFIKNSVTVGATHDISILKLNTGDVQPGRPSLGAWVSYALGSANPDLPAYVVLYDGNREPTGGSVNWSSGFLPAVYQGTAFRPGDAPIISLDRPDVIGARQQQDDLALLKKLNDHRAALRPEDTELQARIRSFDLAYRMEKSAPEAVDISKEPDSIKELYGLNDPASSAYGTNLLRARRLTERGVRFIHIVSGPAGDGATEVRNWDAHQKLEQNHSAHSKQVDKPIAGLLTDLAQRGLLESTIVVWTSEFGRTSYGQSGDGRDHNPWGYTQWIAGGGFKPGYTHGSTDDIGLKSTDKGVDTYDVHATVLNQLGLDHLKTTFSRAGRRERPTVVYGAVVKELIA